MSHAMFALNTATWIGIALLGPFWWGMWLLVIALLGDVVTSWRRPISHLFRRLEGSPAVTTDQQSWLDAA
jgi:hypothetical protein